jgi:hypothetical protein
VAALLLSAGVEVADEAHPEVYADPELPGFQAEMPSEPLERLPDGPPLTFDDLIEFHFLLSDDEALHRAIPHP